MAQITYENKENVNSSTLPDINKINDSDMNMIKSVVNANAVLNNLSEIGLSEFTTLDAIVTAVPNGKTLQLYLSDDNASTLYGTSGGTGNLPTNIAGLLTVERRSENDFAFIKYQTTESIGYPDNNPDGGVYYTTKLNVYRDWIKSGTAEQVLWSNPDPSNVVNADYVIDLSSSDYDELRWIFTYSNTTSNQFSVNCLKGMNVMATTIGYANASLMRRIIDYVSPTQYKCRVAMFNDTEAPGNVIPITVIGIKR
jgi:hypothetical protein|nr:MAG TPA: hypothetical protein [Caudoviricetes sp.]